MNIFPFVWPNLSYLQKLCIMSDPWGSSGATSSGWGTTGADAAGGGSDNEDAGGDNTCRKCKKEGLEFALFS